MMMTAAFCIQSPVNPCYRSEIFPNRKCRRHHHPFSLFLLTNNVDDSSSTFGNFDSLESAITPSTEPVVFEPVVDVSALGTFLFVMTIFGFLSYRTSQVEQAVIERNRAVENLRLVKSRELEGTAAAGDDNDGEKIQQAIERFEKAIEKEDRLRTVIPGFARIVPPSNGNKKEEEARIAAKQFLGRDVNIGAPPRKETGDGRLPTAAIIVLITLFVSQFALLVFLGLDSNTSGMMLDQFSAAVPYSGGS